MALSGTIYGSFSAVATSNVRPAIEWTATQSISGNYSDVTATLVFLRYNTSWGSWNTGHSATFTVDGSKSTASRAFDIRGKSREVVWTRSKRVYHNSDGTKTFSASASGSTGTSLGSYNFSGTGTLNTIPRASSLDAFSISSHLQASTANSISLSIDRKSSSFTHDISLRHGTTTIASWSGQGAPTSLPISSTQVNSLLNRLSTSTSATLTLRVQTKSGSTNIGSVQTRNATATVNSNVKPSISSFKRSINGSGHDSSIGLYVQGVTRVSASFNRSAGYGASITDSYITVRRDTGADSQRINSTSGTTSRAIASSGSYEVIAYARDSRGRSTTSKLTFTAHAYSPPKITGLTAKRRETDDTIIDISYAATASSLSGNNTLTVKVDKSPGTQIGSKSSTTGTVSGSISNTGNDITLSYELHAKAVDSFGNRADATTTVSTAKVVLDIHENQGLGVGKLHQRGALDVSGDIYVDTDLNIGDTVKGKINMFRGGELMTFQSPVDNAYGYLAWYNSYMTRRGYIGYGGSDNDIMTINNQAGELRLYGTQVSVGTTEIVSSAWTSNGYYIRYYDGTQICYLAEQKTVDINSSTSGGTARRTDTITWTFPASFTNSPAVTISTQYNTGYPIYAYLNSSNGSSVDYRIGVPHASALDNMYGYVRCIAIGRWK